MADGEILERLIVDFDANVDKLFSKMNDMDRRLKKHGESAEGFGAALDSVFRRARLTTLDEGGTRVGIFGSALEKLGATGLVAAAGIAAVGLALEEAHKAAEFADGIEKAANAAHVSTDALQEYRFALQEAGGNAEGADEALQAFSATLGKAKEGLGRAVQAFHALRIEPEQLKGMHDTEAVLELVIARIAELKDPSQKDAIIDQMGLKSMAPLINAGLDKLHAWMTEAKNIGVVMDASLVERGAKANREFEKLQQVVSVQLKSALVDLAPVLNMLIGLAAKLARFLADSVDNMRAIENRSERGLRQTISDEQAQIAFLTPMAARNPVAAGNLITHVQRLNQAVDELAARQFADKPDSPGTHDLLPKAGKDHDTVKANLDAIATALEAELRARQAMASTTSERLAIEEKLLDAEIEKRIADNDANKKLTATTRAQAKLSLERERNERAALLERQFQWGEEDAQDKVLQAMFEARKAELEAQIAMATDAQERQKLELELLHMTQVHEKYVRDHANDRAVETGALGPAQAAAIRAAGDAVDASATQTKIYQGFYNPVHEAVTAAIRGGWPGLVQFMGDKLKEKLIDVLTDDIVRGLMGGGASGGGLFGGLFAGIGHALGFADGTSSAPGGIAMVGERGPEPVFLPRGAGVMPSHMMNALARAGSLPARGAASGVTYLHVQVDAKDAVLSQTVAGWIVGGIAAAAPSIRHGAVSDTMNRLARNAYNTIR